MADSLTLGIHGIERIEWIQFNRILDLRDGLVVSAQACQKDTVLNATPFAMGATHWQNSAAFVVLGAALLAVPAFLAARFKRPQDHPSLIGRLGRIVAAPLITAGLVIGVSIFSWVLATILVLVVGAILFRSLAEGIYWANELYSSILLPLFGSFYQTINDILGLIAGVLFSVVHALVGRVIRKW